MGKRLIYCPESCKSEGVRVQSERIKNSAKSAIVCNEKQKDLKVQKQKTGKSLELEKVWGMALAVSCIFCSKLCGDML